MRSTARSFTLAAAAATALFLGMAAPNALAQSDRRSGSGNGRYQAPQGNSRYGRGDRQDRRERFDSRRNTDRRFDRRFEGRRQGDRFDGRFSGRSYGRGFGGRFDNRVLARPFRTVRVFVAFPYPHWVLRRVYDDSTVVYDQDCDPY